MFRKRGSRQVVSMDLHETVLRALVRPREDGADWTLYEAAVPAGYVEEDLIKDEMGFISWMKEQANTWGLKREEVRYFVPDSAVMMKAFDHPDDVTTEGLKGYVQMELGRSIQLPFENPLLDVYDPVEGDKKATLFAAPAEEVMRFANILDDAGVDPTVADIRGLSSIRYFTKRNYLKPEKSYLLVEWLMTGAVVTIFRAGLVEFLRYQPFEREIGTYKASEDGDDIRFTFSGNENDYRSQLVDQVTELERMMTFYRFSIHKGDIAVDEIISFGESPQLDYIDELLRDNPSFPRITTIRDEDVAKFYSGFGTSDVSLVGLALKGDVNESGN